MGIAEKAFTAMYEQLKLELLAELREVVLREIKATAPDETLEIPEAAKHLGISPQLLYKMCSEKLIPHWRAGVNGTKKPKLLFSSVALDEWKREQMKVNYTPVT